MNDIEREERHSKKVWRDIILTDSNGEWRELEKILLTISGAALAATTALFPNGSHSIMGRFLIDFIWIGFGLCLASLVMSYLASEIYSSVHLFRLEKSRKTSLNADDVDALKSPSIRIGIIVLNYMAIVGSLIGIIAVTSLGYFAT